MHEVHVMLCGGGGCCGCGWSGCGGVQDPLHKNSDVQCGAPLGRFSLLYIFPSIIPLRAASQGHVSAVRSASDEG